MEEKQALQQTYFNELDPELRLEVLKRYRESHPQDADLVLYQKLWDLRYTDPKNPKQRVDSFLWQIINLMCLYRVSRFFSKGTEKEISAAMKTLGFSEAAGYGDAGRETLYLEFRNAARRYFGTCDHKAYGKKLMGIVTMNDKERREKMAREVWQLTEGLSDRFETGGDMALFCKAVRDEFVEECPDGAKLLSEQRERRRKKRIAS